MSVIALDLDGTLITNAWPQLGEWQSGAPAAVRTLIDAGHRCFIYSARVSPLWPDGSERSPAQVYMATQDVRKLLDDAGLWEVDIWSGSGKPFWDILVDDKAMRHNGRWRVTLAKTLAYVKDEDTFHAVMDVANDPL